ncbi:endonuclease YncB(thermonuclease family) [Sinorhizobium americanum]|uniref:Endonuclease YncB(Thermonuclease family) n=2 Tax=Sinorhizobium americanum TaxID=194963 RepID=A0A4R2C1N0_9HYPH|nr:endonuclease YncB(thermonuclease family) [Sinorhizobium americanum]
MNLISITASVLLLMCMPTFASATARVVDGDTLDLDGRIYRLHGIDAPEAGQDCDEDGGGHWACGKAAIERLEELVLGNDVRCDDRGQDPYGRTIGVCVAAGVDVNARMVREGMAWAFRKYSEDYSSLEDEARGEHVGVWRHETMAPWYYRAHHWDQAAQASPNGCPIKGNISGNGRIYHAPWSPWYAKTKINEKKGERWFCDEAEAVAAGWRAPHWGR